MESVHAVDQKTCTRRNQEEQECGYDGKRDACQNLCQIQGPFPMLAAKDQLIRFSQMFYGEYTRQTHCGQQKKHVIQGADMLEQVRPAFGVFVGQRYFYLMFLFLPVGDLVF